MRSIVSLCLFFTLTLSHSQTSLFIGPSAQFNYFGWNNRSLLSPSIGGTFGVQHIIIERHAIHTSLSTHWSKHKNYEYDNTFRQTDFIFDLRTEARLCLSRSYPNLFIAPGIGLRYFHAYNYHLEYSEYSQYAFGEFAFFGNIAVGTKALRKAENQSISLVLGKTTWDREYTFYLEFNWIYHFGKSRPTT